MHCSHCDFRGIMEIPGAPLEAPVSTVFRRLGRNPYSGHLHYQCPACDIVHLVEPARVPGKKFMKEFFNRQEVAHYQSAPYIPVITAPAALCTYQHE